MRDSFASFPGFLRPSTRMLLLMIIITALITLIISSMIAIWLTKFSNLNVPSLGTIKTLGVEAYWDLKLENKTVAVDWGTIRTGTTKNVTIYIRSISNAESVLHFNTTNWKPAELSKYMTLSWNYNGTILHPSETIEVTLTLFASFSLQFIQFLITNDVKQFSFDITISTSEYV